MNLPRPRRFRKGVAFLYTTVVLSTLLVFASLAVDLAHVQLVKSQMRVAIDAAARYGATGLAHDGPTARANAVLAASDTLVDSVPMLVNASQDVVLGKWDTTAHAFTALAGSDPAGANAIQVNGKRIAARNNAVLLSFASLVGQKSCDIKSVSAVAMFVAPVDVNQNVPATANPFLAGMPSGSVASLNNPHNSPDYAGTLTSPRQSPLQVNMGLQPGTTLTFDSITGDARHDPNLAYYSPDGQLTDISDNTNGSENGISNLNAPINALVGVFMSDDQPNKSAAPAMLDFSTQASRNFTTMQPQLKQLFFIGDGRTDAGSQQNFVVPKGATRLYLATWDFFEWNNNAGQRNVVVQRPSQIQLVK